MIMRGGWREAFPGGPVHHISVCTFSSRDMYFIQNIGTKLIAGFTKDYVIKDRGGTAISKI